MIPPDEAIAVLTYTLFPNQKEAVVNAMHDIIADVIDSAHLAADKAVHACMGTGETWSSFGGMRLGPEGVARCAQGIAFDMKATVSDYVANHYGIEEFGL